MKIREHRGGLAESMGTVVEIEPTMGSLVAAIDRNLGQWIQVSPEKVHIDPYAYDSRIGWDTYIVTVDGYGVYGFTDGPLA